MIVLSQIQTPFPLLSIVAIGHRGTFCEYEDEALNFQFSMQNMQRTRHLTAPVIHQSTKGMITSGEALS